MPADGQHLASPETADFNGAYPRLSDTQIAALAALGRPRDVQPHEILFREGDRNCDFFVVLAAFFSTLLIVASGAFFGSATLCGSGVPTK